MGRIVLLLGQVIDEVIHKLPVLLGYHAQFFERIYLDFFLQSPVSCPIE